MHPMEIEAIGCNSEINGKASAKDLHKIRIKEENIFKRHFKSVKILAQLILFAW